MRISLSVLSCASLVGALFTCAVGCEVVNTTANVGRWDEASRANQMRVSEMRASRPAAPEPAGTPRASIQAGMKRLNGKKTAEGGTILVMSDHFYFVSSDKRYWLAIPFSAITEIGDYGWDFAGRDIYIKFLDPRYQTPEEVVFNNGSNKEWHRTLADYSGSRFVD